MGWHKQTVADPVAPLTVDRRGSLRAPDIEAAYCGPAISGQYLRTERRALLATLRRTPGVPWKDTGAWAFRWVPWKDTGAWAAFR